jgi:hypothetical protein
VVASTFCNHSVREAEEGELRVQDQPGLHRETLSPKKKKERKKKDTYENSVVNITLNDKTLKLFSPKSGIRR